VTDALGDFGVEVPEMPEIPGLGDFVPGGDMVGDLVGAIPLGGFGFGKKKKK